jgi:hypothetical protein
MSCAYFLGYGNGKYYNLMPIPPTDMPLFRHSYAAEELSDAWRLACLKAMGLEGWEIVPERRDESSGSKFQVINLLYDQATGTSDDDEADEDTSPSNRDPWMQTAVQIQKNILEMAAWIRQKQTEYIKVDMPDEEASLIQSTVTSFTATTANEIESLHQCVVGSSGKTQKQQHCAGIVQILMTELKEGIAEPFGRIQKQRHRTAVQLWHTPLQCRLWTARPKTTSKEKDPTLELLGLDENETGDGRDVDQRFQPTRPSHRLHREFLQSYEMTTLPVKPQRPPSLFRVDEPKFEIAHPVPAKAQLSTKQQQNQHQQFSVAYYPSDEDDGIAAAAALQQEAVLLLAKTHNDLDAVQKMEHMMVDITTLLSQFANLVSEQQEDVWEIHDSAVSSKENLQKGQENLMDAKERTEASKHYMATAITAMGVLLLLFNWLRS